MRVLHIMAGKGLGGAETYATDMMLSLHAAGVDQCIVMNEKAPRFREVEAAGLRMAPEVLKWPLRFFQRQRLERLIAEEKPDLIHCWMRRAASLMPRKKLDIPVIGWFGGYYDPKHFKACSHFVGVTKGIVAHQVRSGIDKDKAFFVQTFPDIQPIPAIARASLDTPEDVPVILALSRLHPKKGLDTLLDAVSHFPEAYVWLAGEGPLRDSLMKQAGRLGLMNRVRFLGWRTDRAALLRAADICVLPSRYEPFGTVILEAWAAKTPLVACESAGPAAHVRQGETGILVPIDSVDALHAALRRVAFDADLRQKLKDNGYAEYCKDYTREAVTAKMKALYSQLIEKAK